MPTVKKRVDAEPIRLQSIEIFRRKVHAYKDNPSVLVSGPAYVAAVFNKSEIALLRRIAQGEWFPGITLDQKRAQEELDWIARGGTYPQDEDDDAAS
jgi:hypothetical protein